MLGHHYPNVDKSQQLANYVEDYLECVESLPLDIQRNVSVLREIDAKYQEVLKEVDEVFEKYKAEQDGGQRKRLQVQLQRALIVSQELGDEKIHVVTQMTELVENRSRQMDSHSLCLQEPREPERPATERRANVQEPPAGASAGAAATAAGADRASARRPRRQRNSESRDSGHPSANGSAADDAADEPPVPLPREKSKSKSTKKKKRKSKQERDASPVDFAIDPNEPTYCLCEQVSYGEMIGCDNDQCPIEWFHFSCVGLTYKPKGKWYCPKCRGDNEKTMDKSLDKNRKDRRSR
ncbi:inhibitor of growth protein 2 [Corythoichthys intestinalis]|uniref:inhibitor of growth protein 2 n=1 Tax=Corythoichthys intestinalis TaxID=161448 RepID=UPI0025A5DE61|nr:inhibitor of growth protein 2 [Corythoichthys intestinalis]XP_061810982.1 inhibitor of growth protein 2-like [Nerophis lumbriciformis]